MATLDGPGLRTVVFLQGCPLKCKFCHNVDCAIKTREVTQYTVAQLSERLLKYREYWQKSGSPGDSDDKHSHIAGGITLSGGEPTYQAEFVGALAARFQKMGIHVAIDSCSVTSSATIEKLVPYIDLWMLSVKQMDNAKHKFLTGSANTAILSNITLTDRELTRYNREFCAHKQIRIRYLVIPGYTDSKEDILALSEFVRSIQNLETLELLAYGSHGKHKWYQLFGSYPLEDVADATRDDLERVAGWIGDKVPVKM